MTNQIQPSHAQEEQPERFYCRHCGEPMFQVDGYFARQMFAEMEGCVCHHEPERRLPKNAWKRREVDEYLETERGH